MSMKIDCIGRSASAGLGGQKRSPIPIAQCDHRRGRIGIVETCDFDDILVIRKRFGETSDNDSRVTVVGESQETRDDRRFVSIIKRPVATGTAKLNR